MSTKERLPTNNTEDVESPFLSDEFFAVEPKEEWELRTAALAEETPYVGGQAQFSDAMSAVRATGTTGRRNFTVNDGTVLTPRLEIFAHDLSAAFERRTGKQIHVTSGVRTPEAQARAMWTKWLANEDLTKLYRNKTAVNEVIAAAKGQPEVVAIPAMMTILTAQMGRGVYLSGHMRANSIDVRSKTMSEAEKRACEAAMAELRARWLYEGEPPHYHVDMPSAVAAHEAPSYWALGRDALRESEAVVDREDECLLGNPDDRETFETAAAVEDTETMQGLLDVGEAPPAVPPGLNTYQLKSGEPTVTLPDGSTLFNNAGTLLWTPREAKVIGLREPVIIMPDGQGQAVLWPANVPAPKSAKPIELRPPHLFMQAQFFTLKIKCTSDKKQCEFSLKQSLSDNLEFAVSETGEGKLTASVDLPVYDTPVYVGFAGSIDSRAQVKGQAQVGVKGGEGPIKVKGGVEVLVRVDPAQLMVVVGEKALSLRNAIKQGIRVAKWDPINEPIRAVFGHEMSTPDPSVVGHEVSYETGEGEASVVSCALKPLVDGPEIFEAMEAALLAAKQFIYVTAWMLYPDVKLKSKTLREILKSRAAANVDVRILLCDLDAVMAHLPREKADWETGIAEKLKHDHIKVCVTKLPIEGMQMQLLENVVSAASGYPVVFASHHQKSVMMDGPEGPVVFCSGCDFTRGVTNKKGWHDASIMIKGPCGKGVIENFVQRWNKEAADTPSFSPLPMPTYSCNHNWCKVVRTMPGSKKEIQEAYLDAIKGAKKSIYMENQYLRDPDIGRELVKAVERGVKVEIILPTEPEEAEILSVKSTGLEKIPARIQVYSQYRILMALVTQEPAAVSYHYSKLQLLKEKAAANLQIKRPSERRQPYIHAKIIIVDDKIAIIGSANANCRSMRDKCDSEIDVRVEEPQPVFTRTLKLKLDDSIGKKLEQYTFAMIGRDELISRIPAADMRDLQTKVTAGIEKVASRAGDKVKTIASWLSLALSAPAPEDFRDFLTDAALDLL